MATQDASTCPAPSPWPMDFQMVKFGNQVYNGGNGTIWYDDVALSAPTHRLRGLSRPSDDGVRDFACACAIVLGLHEPSPATTTSPTTARLLRAIRTLPKVSGHLDAKRAAAALALPVWFWVAMLRISI